MGQEHGSVVYPDVGRCIYCGSNDQKLQKEHIVPFALGGNLILPRASCSDCARITGATEGFCLRSMLGPTRIRLKLPTRRPKERPAILPLEVIRVGGGREQKMVPASEVPLSLLGFRFPPPGVLRGVPPTDRFDGDLVARLPQQEFRDHLKPAGQRVKLSTINILSFSRMLAKIAHSYAVANLGLGAFRPMLLDLILGRCTAGAHVVGGDPALPVEPPEPILHHLYMQNCVSNGVEYTLVAIQLFVFAGMPRYHVVVGESLRDKSTHEQTCDTGIVTYRQ